MLPSKFVPRLTRWCYLKKVCVNDEGKGHICINLICYVIQHDLICVNHVFVLFLKFCLRQNKEYCLIKKSGCITVTVITFSFYFHNQSFKAAWEIFITYAGLNMQVNSYISTVIYNFTNTIQHKRSLSNCRMKTVDCWMWIMKIFLKKKNKHLRGNNNKKKEVIFYWSSKGFSFIASCWYNYFPKVCSLLDFKDLL